MSNSVAALPDGIGIASIADRRPRRESSDRRGGSRPADRDPTFEPRLAHGESQDAAPAPADELLVPAETLFAATLFASALLRLPPSTNEMMLRTAQGWQPPDSVLRLKDKTI